MAAYTHLVQRVLLPAVSLCTDSRFWPIYRRLVGREAFTTPANIISRQLCDLLAHAHRSVSFYRERMESCGLTVESYSDPDSLCRLPLTSKADISANFPDCITDSSRRFRPWRYRVTSGTIERLTVIHDVRKRDSVRAADLLGLKFTAGYQPGMKFLEIPPDACRHVCGSSNGPEPSVYRFVIDNLKAGRIRHPDVLSDIRGLVERQIVWRKVALESFGVTGLAQPPAFFQQYLDRIASYEPYVLKALPVYLYILALHIKHNKVKPPRVRGGILPMGSSLSPFMKRTVEQAFESEVHEDYGCAELGCIGSECGHRNGIHPFTALFHIEVLKDGRPARAGELGKVVITDLNSYAMPFIRYDIGDVAVVRNGRCGCGLEGPRLELKGRLQDCLIAADGSLVSSDDIADAILSCPGVRLFQLEVRTADHVDLQIMPMRDRTPDITQIHSRLSDLLGRRPRLTHRLVRSIRPEQSGKYRLVKNSLPVEP